MNDSAQKGIQNTKKEGQFRKDKAAYEKKGSAQSRRGSSSSGISSSTSSSSQSSKANSTTRSSSSSSSFNSKNTTRRMQNQKNVNKAINVLKKVPVTRKYAQMAEKIQKIKNSRAAGFFGGMMNKIGNKSDANADDIEEMKRAEQSGEEYKPDAAEGRYTAITTRQMKILVVVVLAGIVIGAVFFCVILVSSLTDSGGKAYLASKSNPTEEELEEWYNGQKDESSSSSSSSVDSRVKQDSTDNIIMVGDSRTVGLCNSVYGISVTNCSTLGYKKDKNTFISLTSTAYDWFKSTALPEIKKQLNSNENSTVFINMGTNRLDDLTNQANSYAGDYNELAKTYPKANIVAISVTPIIDAKVSYFKNVNLDSNVVKFNNQLKSKISSDVIYCDVYSKVKGKVDASDGVHYNVASYKLINDEILNCIKPSNSISSTGKAVVDKMNQIALTEAENATSREKYQKWFGLYDNWCGMFVSWLFNQVDGLDKYYVMAGQAGPGARESVSKGYGKWYEDECTDSKTVPQPGDVMHSSPCVPGDECYMDKYSSGHVGYVYKVDDDYIYTVEGNHDPEKVVTVKHSRKDCNINGYYRPNY